VWTYVVRRLLLMGPMLFAISLINFGIINMTPPPKSSNLKEGGDFDTSKALDANEAENIFRQTFNLDKPVFFNTRYSIEDTEVFWHLATHLRPWETPADRRASKRTLDDYGRTVVPHLLRIAEATLDGSIESRFRADYEERWAKVRAAWMRGDRPPGLSWPPPEAAPPFDEGFRTRTVELALGRLANNAPRRPKALFGDQASDEVVAFNREVREEQVRLQRIYLDRKTSPGEKLALWRAWVDENRGEWEYGFLDKVHMFFLETRFARFWDNLLHFDLGRSSLHKKKVWDLILERLPVSLTLSAGALVLAYLISIPLGILSAVTHRSLGDVIVSFLLFVAYSFPTIFLGLLFVKYFGIQWKLFPVAGFNSPGYDNLTVLQKLWDRVRHVVMPMAVLTVGSLAYYSRYMKAGLIEIIRSDFVRTARAKGLSEFVVVVKHAARNGLIPIITLLGASLPVLIGGSIVVEVIFEIDGMGKLGYEAVRGTDYAVIMGINILVAVLTLIGVFLSDLVYAIVDPRISFK